MKGVISEVTVLTRIENVETMSCSLTIQTRVGEYFSLTCNSTAAFVISQQVSEYDRPTTPDSENQFTIFSVSTDVLLEGYNFFNRK